MKKSNSINWITPFNVTIMKSKCPKEHVNFMIEAVTLLLDNEILCEELDASDGLVGNVTNEVHIPQLPGIEGINGWIKEQAKKYVNRNFKKNESEYNKYQKAYFSQEPEVSITSEWVVRMNPGDFNPAHFHTNCHLSGLIYLKIPEGFEKDAGGNIHFLHGNPADYYENQYQVTPKVGDMYLWPSWLQHFVYPYKCEGERWVMPFNILISHGEIKGV